MPKYIISTAESNVWLVEADDPDAAEAEIADRVGVDPGLGVFYEGTLDEHLRDLDRDGIALLNS